MMHIRDCLPEMKSRISSLLADVQGNLDELGDSTDSLESNRLGSILLRLLSKFSLSFCETVDGRKGSELGGVDTSELYGGARISYIFNEIFGRTVKALDPFAGLTDVDIRTAIANANGPRPALFVPEISFDLLVRKQIVRLEQPGIQCVDLVFAEMQRMAYQSETGDLSRFPNLRERVFEIVNQILRKCLAPTQSMISNIISIELAYINTSHPDFIGGKQAVAQLTKRHSTSDPSGKGLASPPPNIPVSVQNGHSENQPGNVGERPISGSYSERTERVGSDNPLGSPVGGNRDSVEAPRGFFGLFRPSGSNPGIRDRGAQASREAQGGLVKLPQVPERMQLQAIAPDREKIETEIIKNLIGSYFDIVKKNFMDLVPKTVMHFLVNQFKDSLQNTLVAELYKDATMQDLMRENEDVAAKRKELREMRDMLERALDIVNEVRDYNTFKA